ncbi:hypothetical protein EJ02DRAFT_258118 [Clathrospora elynae]|uniref:Uncharacterized protein n=1 Tax=Clathrospora elynae TaxID=706981 RepID=A0A6A5SHK0_9PLEO|nr:hypothetical protein EJ02DRAFT_258118 [Clathrospora elynae]
MTAFLLLFCIWLEFRCSGSYNSLRFGDMKEVNAVFLLLALILIWLHLARELVALILLS